jgi:hypothetical protein
MSKVRARLHDLVDSTPDQTYIRPPRRSTAPRSRLRRVWAQWRVSLLGVGALTIAQSRGLPRLYASSVRNSASPPILSVFARRWRGDVATETGSTTWASSSFCSCGEVLFDAGVEPMRLKSKVGRRRLQTSRSISEMGLVELTSTAMVVAVGITSCFNSQTAHQADLDQIAAIVKTIGIVLVAALAANAAGVLVAAITFTPR